MERERADQLRPLLPIGEWLRSNPHRLHPGRIGFRLTRTDGREATPPDSPADGGWTVRWEGLRRMP
jgi:hypothetical protein